MLSPTDRARLEAFARSSIAKLYASARPRDPSLDLDPFVLDFGPDLQRHPRWRCLLDDHMLQDIDAAMAEQGALYTQFRDLLDILSLQDSSSVPTQQRAEHAIPGRTDDEYDEAVAQLTAFAASPCDPPVCDPDELTRFVQSNVPFVLKTVHMVHHMEWQNGRKVPLQPLSLSPEWFVAWFENRLLLTLELRLERYWDNPLWVARNGQYQEVRTPTPKEWADFGTLIQLVCQGGKPRRRPEGSGYFRDARAFETTISRVMGQLIQEGRHPTQAAVQTPPRPPLHQCIIKAVGILAVEKPLRPSKTMMNFSGRPRKSSRLNDA